ncbi:TPA: hypothetical protein ONA81_005819 [Pseudomonas aeruginosa]|uniref:hypothetical protein n=1 Tax=Pseudomonas aeruginosa TaxID=287 RepID=UPI000E67C92F|nr:hypothetical protein [Pseudomonas aeruginosa]RIY89758.1 hypothetical protein AXW94_30255 [Pseudomonas aeruginosa]RPM25423.1 hypothetical protein IPC1293_32375 [Pseudomonas aeruginosa]HBP4970263.1 hypothetical protein [Pseudomonas aeruginosa]HBP6081422.1 hypothetical protein [Pseudomonas aeruginosa]HBP6093958.1 hypothetical protein [Pseudomonas aeruginosa]
MEHQETSLRVAYALHSSSPGAWGWEVTSREGYGWGTAPTEAEAILDGLAYLQRVAQLIRLEASPRDQALR